MGLVLGERLIQEEWSSLGNEIMGFRISRWRVGIASNEVEGIIHKDLWIPLCEKIIDNLHTKNQIRHAIRGKTSN